MTVPGLVQLTAPVESYTAEFVELDPEDSQFTTDLDNPPGDGNVLEVDPAAEAEVRAVLDEITDDGDSPIEIARAIQAYLRGPLFTYSLELADQAADGNLSDEPLARFLETKRGYCVQFTSAMVMLAREAGIPARMAIGYLPGAIDGDDRVVRVSDAHAWPELYFPRLGWVRFEPTPGTRSGVAPEYSLVPTDTGSSSSASPTSSTSTSSPSPSTGPTRDVTDDPTTGGDRHRRRRRAAVRQPARPRPSSSRCSWCWSARSCRSGRGSRAGGPGAPRATTPSWSRPSGSRCCCACRTSGSSPPTGRPHGRPPAGSGTTPTSPPTRTTPWGVW